MHIERLKVNKETRKEGNKYAMILNLCLIDGVMAC